MKGRAQRFCCMCLPHSTLFPMLFQHVYLPRPLSTHFSHTFQQPCCYTYKVVDGFEVVKAVESVGSRSGATSYEVIVSDCGSLPKGERKE